MKILRIGALFALLAFTWVVRTYHIGVFPPPDPHHLFVTQPAPAVWIDKARYGIHQLVLFGTPYERGLEAGRLTKPLLLRQERELNEQLRTFVPNELLIKGVVLFGIQWFHGIQDYFEPWMTEEMYGVSKSAPHEYDGMIDGYTRQIAYHGLHEVGQMMVDQSGDDMGCTVVAVPSKGTWVLGRNFDFEGGRTFDSEKIMKWVFPDKGNAYVSVIWAGMVGGVTGVNEHGLYISLNAAGTTDFRRYGTPTTLVLLKALQFAKTGDEAIEIIKNATTFITDIFVLLDSKAGKLYRIEKSPKRFEIIPLSGPSIVVNHLIAPLWNGDRINEFRRTELTSHVRGERGEQLLKTIDLKTDPKRAVLSVMRDKGEADGKPLHLGNRRAIDAMIATHGVVFDAPAGVFYVSRGPGLSGAFEGFDLKQSFEKRTPVAVDELPRDPLVSDKTFSDIRSSAKELSKAEKFLKKRDCAAAEPLLESARVKFEKQYAYSNAWGDYLDRCKNDREGARKAWQEALALHPAYARETRDLEEKLRK